MSVMKILAGSPLSFFTRTFLPNFSKSTVSDQIAMLREELKTKTLPPYRSALEQEVGFRGRRPFKAKWPMLYDAKAMNEKINHRNREFPYQPLNVIELVGCILETLEGKFKYLEELIVKSFSDDIVNTQLTFQQANLLRLAEMSEFYLIYARKFLIMLIDEEYKGIDAKAGKYKPLVKGDVKWLEKHFPTFIQMSIIYSQDKENFIRAIKKIPELTIPESKDEYELAEKVHGENLDPHGMRFVPYVFNPIYHIRSAILNWRHSRIESAKTEREYLELRLQQYRMKRGGVDNAKMEQVIEATEERLKKLNLKITEMEESYSSDYGV